MHNIKPSMKKTAYLTALHLCYLTALLLCYLTALLLCCACQGNLIEYTDEPVSENSAADDGGITTVDGTISIVFSDSGAKVSGDTDGIVTVSGTDVTARNTTENCYTYSLSGTCTDGSFKLYSEGKQVIELGGLSLTNPEGAAINNQSHKYTSVVVKGENYLADGSVDSSGEYRSETSDEDMKGAFFSEGQLVFSGDGSLTVKATGKAGISSDDYISITETPYIKITSSAGHGLRGKDSVTVDGGTLDISVSGAGAKGIKSDGDGYFSSGTVKVIVTGSNTGSSGSGQGWGWGWSDSEDEDSSSAKALKFDGNLYFSGADVTASAASHEAIEAKGTLSITAGNISATSSDDAINSGSDLTISGGSVYAFSSGNDGIDANGNMYIEGGYVFAVGCGSPEVALDANTEQNCRLYIKGGTVIAVGGIESGSSLSQAVVNVSSWKSNTSYSLYDGDTLLVEFTAPSKGGSGIVISHPSLKSGSSYTLKYGTSSSTLTASLSSQDGGGQGGNPGGGGGHGGGRW